MDEAALSRLRHAIAVSIGTVEPNDAETEATAMLYVFALELCVWIGVAALVFIVGAGGAAAFCGHQLCTCRRQCPKLHARVMATLAYFCRGTNGENEDDEHDWNGGSVAANSAASSRLGRAGGVDFDAGQIGERAEYTPFQRAAPLAAWLGAALLLVSAASTGAAFTATLVEATQSGSLEAHCMAGEIEAWSAALGGALDNATSMSRGALRDASDTLTAHLLDSTIGFRELATENGDVAAALIAAQGRHVVELDALAPADGTLSVDSTAIVLSIAALRARSELLVLNVSSLLGGTGALHRSTPPSSADLTRNARGGAALLRMNETAAFAWGVAGEGALRARQSARLVRAFSAALNFAANGSASAANRRDHGGGAGAASVSHPDALAAARDAVGEIAAVVSSLRAATLPIVATDAASMLRLIGAFFSVAGGAVLVCAALLLLAPLPAAATLWWCSRRAVSKGLVASQREATIFGSRASGLARAEHAVRGFCQRLCAAPPAVRRASVSCSVCALHGSAVVAGTIAIVALALSALLAPTVLLWSDACAVLRDVERDIAPYVGVVPFDESLGLNASSELSTVAAGGAAYAAGATWTADAASTTATATDPVRGDGASVYSVDEARAMLRRRRAVAALQQCVARPGVRQSGAFVAALGAEAPIARIVAAYNTGVVLLSASDDYAATAVGPPTQGGDAALDSEVGRQRFAAPVAATLAVAPPALEAASPRAVALNESAADAASAAHALAAWAADWLADCQGSTDAACQATSAAYVAALGVQRAALTIAGGATEIGSDARALSAALHTARASMWIAVRALQPLAAFDSPSDAASSACGAIRERADATLNILCVDGIGAAYGLSLAFFILAAALFALAFATNRLRVYWAHVAVELMVEIGTWQDEGRAGGGLGGDERAYVNEFMRDEMISTDAAASHAILIARQAAGAAESCTVGLTAVPPPPKPEAEAAPRCPWLRSLFGGGPEAARRNARVQPDIELGVVPSFDFDALDRDHNGRVDESELAAALSSAVLASGLSTAVEDGDVALSSAAMQNFALSLRGEFSEVAIGATPMGSKEETQAGLAKSLSQLLITKYDADGDGVLDPEEFALMEEQMAAWRQSHATGETQRLGSDAMAVAAAVESQRGTMVISDNGEEEEARAWLRDQQLEAGANAAASTPNGTYELRQWAREESGSGYGYGAASPSRDERTDYSSTVPTPQHAARSATAVAAAAATTALGACVAADLAVGAAEMAAGVTDTGGFALPAPDEEESGSADAADAALDPDEVEAIERAKVRAQRAADVQRREEERGGSSFFGGDDESSESEGVERADEGVNTNGAAQVVAVATLPTRPESPSRTWNADARNGAAPSPDNMLELNAHVGMEVAVELSPEALARKKDAANRAKYKASLKRVSSKVKRASRKKKKPGLPPKKKSLAAIAKRASKKMGKKKKSAGFADAAADCTQTKKRKKGVNVAMTVKTSAAAAAPKTESAPAAQTPVSAALAAALARAAAYDAEQAALAGNGDGVDSSAPDSTPAKKKKKKRVGGMRFAEEVKVEVREVKYDSATLLSRSGHWKSIEANVDGAIAEDEADIAREKTAAAEETAAIAAAAAADAAATALESLPPPTVVEARYRALKAARGAAEAARNAVARSFKSVAAAKIAHFDYIDRCILNAAEAAHGARVAADDVLNTMAAVIAGAKIAHYDAEMARQRAEAKALAARIAKELAECKVAAEIAMYDAVEAAEAAAAELPPIVAAAVLQAAFIAKVAEAESLHAAVVRGGPAINDVVKGRYVKNKRKSPAEASPFMKLMLLSWPEILDAPTYTHMDDESVHLFRGKVDGRWFIGDTKAMEARKTKGWLSSIESSPSPLGLDWCVFKGGEWLKMDVNLVVEAAPAPVPVTVEVIGGDGVSTEDSNERRAAADGEAYTKSQFIEHYGGTDQWDVASPVTLRQRPHLGAPGAAALLKGGARGGAAAAALLGGGVGKKSWGKLKKARHKVAVQAAMASTLTNVRRVNSRASRK